MHKNLQLSNRLKKYHKEIDGKQSLIQWEKNRKNLNPEPNTHVLRVQSNELTQECRAKLQKKKYEA